MSRSTRRRVLAAWALTLCPTARASEIRFAPEIPAASAARWESRAREDWSSWEGRFGVRIARGGLTVSLADPSAMPTDFGRSRNGRIELNRLLTQDAAGEVLSHELAHVFFEGRCAGLAKSAPILSEAFALFASGDAQRRAFEGTRFLYAASARDWLVAHAGEAHGSRGDSRAAQEALARVLALPERSRAFEAYFAALLGSCGDETFAASGAVVTFLDVVRAEPEIAPSRADFLLVDGLAGETLAEDGHPRAHFPPGSILKPSLVAAVPALMESRAARDAPEWRCPAHPKPGESFTWQRALTLSCNGFFLDFAAASPNGFEAWEDEMRRLGPKLPDRATTTEERIGLEDGITLSPLDAVRVFTWLDRKTPFVVDALRGTPRSGTLAAAPEAGWFADRGIALKTGTVRDLASAPLHAWIVAVGPRDASGAPAFVAALHATGRATSSLLPDLKRRLVSGLTGLERAAEVQILALVPEAGVGLACDGGAPLLVRAGGEWRLAKPQTALAQGTLESGATYSCPAAALTVTFADGRGATLRRRYFGALRVEAPPPAGAPSSVPLRERSARARRGSRFVLSTSERAYVTSSLLSELPEGHLELLAALSLVVRHNRLARRHGDRPPCDTTHCNLFGQDEKVSREARARARQAVAAAARFEIAAPEGGREWLPFSLGGRKEWSEIRTRATVAEALGLGSEPARLVRAADGRYEVAPALRLRCEVLRNQLHLPSCPDEVVTTEAGFAFRGNGEGHGAGLDLTSASAAAAEGAGFQALLARAWPDLQIVPSPPPGR